MQETIELLKKEILTQVPQIPFVIDQVSTALDWCVKAHDEGDIVKLLKTSLDVAKYVKEVSDPNFYKTHLLIASLIGEIPNVTEDEKFKIFQTASRSVEETIKDVVIDQKLMEDRGCFSAMNIWLCQLARKDMDKFIVVLYGILNDLKETVDVMKEANVKSPITPNDYIKILGYAYVTFNLKVSNLGLWDRAKVILNEISQILNNDVIF